MTPNRQTQAYIQSLGIDPAIMMQEGWTDTEYIVLVNDSFGSHYESREWPTEFNRELLLEAMRKDGLIR